MILISSLVSLFSISPVPGSFFFSSFDPTNIYKIESEMYTIGVDDGLGAETLVGCGGGVGLDREVDVSCGGVDGDLAVLEEGDEGGAVGLVAGRGGVWLLRGLSRGE